MKEEKSFIIQNQQIKDLNLDYVLAYEEKDKLLLVEKIKISRKANPEDWLACLLLCNTSRKLYNSALYAFRQQYFNNQTILSYETLAKQFKQNMHFCDLPAKVSQQTLKLLSQNISSYFALIQSEKLTQAEKTKRKLPQYYSKKGLCPIMFTNQALYKKTFQQEGLLHLSETDLKFKSKVIQSLEDFNQLLQQVRIIPFNKNRKSKELNDLQDDSPFIVEIVYKAKAKINSNQECNLSALSTQNKTTVSYQTKKGETKEKKVIEKILSLDLNQMQFASIDHNVNNLAIACYNNQSFLYSLKPLKSANHIWNKKTVYLQSRIDNLINEIKWLKQSVKTFSVFQSIFDNKNLKSFLTEETYQILLQQEYEKTLLFIQQTEIGIKKLINKRKRLTTKRNNFVENYSHQLSRQLINQLQQQSFLELIISFMVKM